MPGLSTGVKSDKVQSAKVLSGAGKRGGGVSVLRLLQLQLAYGTCVRCGEWEARQGLAASAQAYGTVGISWLCSTDKVRTHAAGVAV